MKNFLLLHEKKLLLKIQKTVGTILKNENSGHDYQHAYRVMCMNQYLAKNYSADFVVLSIAGLLHDIAYPEIKTSRQYFLNHLLSAKKAEKILKNVGLGKELIQRIVLVIKQSEYTDSKKTENILIESKIQQDSDKLDSIGAIGIGRVFLFAGAYKIPVHNPKILPRTSFDARETSKTVINHFYEKLLRLDKGYHTKEATEIAKQRVSYMKNFLKKFLEEYEGAK